MFPTYRCRKICVAQLKPNFPYRCRKIFGTQVEAEFHYLLLPKQIVAQLRPNFRHLLLPNFFWNPVQAEFSLHTAAEKIL